MLPPLPAIRYINAVMISTNYYGKNRFLKKAVRSETNFLDRIAFFTQKNQSYSPFLSITLLIKCAEQKLSRTVHGQSGTYPPYFAVYPLHQHRSNSPYIVKGKNYTHCPHSLLRLLLIESTFYFIYFLVRETQKKKAAACLLTVFLL